MIITSLLDTDLYKFTMMQVVLHQFPGAQVEYKFKCRNPGVPLAPFVDEIRQEIRSLCSLSFKETELQYLRMLRFIKSDFVDFLGLFKLNEKCIEVLPLPTGEIGHRQRGVLSQHPKGARPDAGASPPGNQGRPIAGTRAGDAQDR
jgi:nicotinate phosphoribosyltransferase